MLVNYLFKGERIDYTIAMNNYYKDFENQRNEELINNFTYGKIKYLFNDNELLHMEA